MIMIMCGSMDVVNLYPSVPIDTALRVVIEFAQDLWDKIDNFGVSIEQFSTMLKIHFI